MNGSEAIDFSGIRSISRAFAHDLLCCLEEFQQKGTRIELLHLNSDVSKLIELVKSSLTNDQPHYRPELFPRRVSFDEASEHFDELH